MSSTPSTETPYTGFSPHGELLAATFYNSSEGLFVIDSEMRIVLYNPAAAELTGWAGDDPIDIGCRVLAGRACPITDRALFNPADCPGPKVLLGLQEAFTNEVELVDRSGLHRACEVTYVPVRHTDGSLRFILGTLRDISERRELEEQLIQSKKLASLGTLVAGIAHELRNPLGIIRSAAEILANEERTGPQRREAMDLILEETKRLDRSIREFLTFARPRPARADPMDLGVFVRRVIDLLLASRPGGGMKIEQHHAPDLPRVKLDTDLMRQVIDNLLSNAEQSAPESDRPVNVRVSTSLHGERRVRLEFSDDGDGIDPENLGKLYDPFFTTKRDGTGLGLSIVHQIVTQHRGRLIVSSEPGVGTTFTIDLPIHTPNLEEDTP